MSEQRYHFRDILVAETPAPSTRALLHRELGQELVGLTEQVLRLDAPDDKLHEYIEHIRQLRTDLAQYGQRDYNGILQRLLAGEGSADDVTDLVDFEILTGKASPCHHRWSCGWTGTGSGAGPRSAWLSRAHRGGYTVVSCPWRWIC